MSIRVPHHPLSQSNHPILKRLCEAGPWPYENIRSSNVHTFGLPSSHDLECVRDIFNWKDGKQERLKLSQKYHKFRSDVRSGLKNLNIKPQAVDSTKPELIPSRKFYLKKVKGDRVQESSNIPSCMNYSASKLNIEIEKLIQNHFGEYADRQLEMKYQDLLVKKKKRDSNGVLLKSHPKYYINQNKIDAINIKPFQTNEEVSKIDIFKLKKFTQTAKAKIDTSLKSDWRKNIPSPYTYTNNKE